MLYCIGNWGNAPDPVAVASAYLLTIHSQLASNFKTLANSCDDNDDSPAVCMVGMEKEKATCKFCMFDHHDIGMDVSTASSGNILCFTMHKLDVHE